MVELILDKNKQPIGWKMSPKTKEEQEIVATIRNLQFFGINIGNREENTNIKYNGIELIDDTKGKVLGNIKSLSWIQAKHQTP